MAETEQPVGGQPTPEEQPSELTAEERQAAIAAGELEMPAYAATLRRVERLILALGAAVAVGGWWPLGWQTTLGMLGGIALSWLNFRWLAASVNGIGERIVKGESRERGAAIVVRGVGRIFLMAFAAYGIFTCSLRGLVGFLAGLTMPVIALMCEAAYEFVAGNRRTS